MSIRVAHVINGSHVAGAERFLAALLREGRRRGWDQLVLNLLADPSSTELSDVIRPVPHKAFPAQGVTGLVKQQLWLTREVTGFHADVVHVLLFPSVVAMAVVPRSKRSTRIITNVYGESLKVLPHRRLREPLDRWAGRRGDHVIAISESVKRFLVAEYGYPATLVKCIPLGFEGQPLSPVRDDRPPTIVCVAALRREKGHDVLVRAFRAVKAQVPDARLVLVGGGQLEPDITRAVQEMGLAGSVQVTGLVADIWPYLAAADVFALASLSEAYGIAVVEAMAAGLPVVASAVGGIPELVAPGVTGELFPPGDADAMAAHLVALLTSPERRASMGAAARHAATAHSLEGSVTSYADFFEEAAAATGAVTPVGRGRTVHRAR